jgi:hypothetical protein
MDVSGSMTTSIRNPQMADLSRLGGVEQAVRSTLRDLQRLAGQQGVPADLAVRVFLYAFGLRISPGFGDLLGILRAARAPDFSEFQRAAIERAEVRAQRKGEEMKRSSYESYGGLASLARSYGFGSLVDSAGSGMQREAEARLRAEAEAEVFEALSSYIQKQAKDATLPVEELVQLLADTPLESGAERLIFGNTPMAACLAGIEKRFQREPRLAREQCVLLIISDGEPTDGDPEPIARRLREAGISVLCAFLTGCDLATPRLLRSHGDPAWTPGARLMWSLASTVGDVESNETGGFSGWRAALESGGWEVEPDAHLFVQINHSETLADFLRVAATAVPLSELCKVNVGSIQGAVNDLLA